MSGANVYDVTEWPVGNPAEDIGVVINSIIADVKARQMRTDDNGGGKPGAVIYIPPGDYHLRTQVVIDVSYLKIQGSGHGFSSLSIRFNLPQSQWPELHELWPGGSRVIVDLSARTRAAEPEGAAFLVERSGSPRISSVEFSNFCIDGLHFDPDGSSAHPENTYINGKTGVHVASANDSFRFTGMGFVYLQHALTIYNADALSIHDNFIAECGNCIELRGWGQASKITDNLIGAGFRGYSIYAQNHGGLLVTANNVFPRGASCIHFDGVKRANIANNRLHSFYPGMVILAADSAENLIASNHFLRDREPWAPFADVDNGLDDLHGLLRVDGNNNSIIGNHFSEVVDSRQIRPEGARPTIMRLRAGEGNHVANNHVVALNVSAKTGQSAVSSQVDGLLAADATDRLPVTTVLVDPESTSNVILDSGDDAQVLADRSRNAIRPTPSPVSERRPAGDVGQAADRI